MANSDEINITARGISSLPLSVGLRRGRECLLALFTTDDQEGQEDSQGATAGTATLSDAGDRWETADSRPDSWEYSCWKVKEREKNFEIKKGSRIRTDCPL